MGTNNKPSVVIYILIGVFILISIGLAIGSKQHIFSKSPFIDLNTYRYAIIDREYKIITSQKQMDKYPFKIKEELDFDRYQYILFRVNEHYEGEYDFQPVKYTIHETYVSIDLEYSTACSETHTDIYEKPTLLYGYYLLPINRKLTVDYVYLNESPRNQPNCSYDDYLDD